MFGGVLVSLLVQYLKNKFKTNTAGTLGIVAILSLIGGAAYYFLQQYNMLDAVIQILVTAGAFYTFFLKNIVDAMQTTTTVDQTSK